MAPNDKNQQISSGTHRHVLGGLNNVALCYLAVKMYIDVYMLISGCRKDKKIECVVLPCKKWLGPGTKINSRKLTGIFFIFSVSILWGVNAWTIPMKMRRWISKEKLQNDESLSSPWSKTNTVHKRPSKLSLLFVFSELLESFASLCEPWPRRHAHEP